jgi:serine protease
MSKTNLKKVAAGALALTLAAIWAQPADAVTRHHHPQRLRNHNKKIAKVAFGQPSAVPILDSDLNRQSVTTQFAMSQIRAQLAHEISTGAGVTVAILDGGFDLTHEDLQGCIVSTDVDMVDYDGDSQDLGDSIDNDNDGNTDWLVGHGTFVASLVHEVAPNAMILPIRVLDDEGWGTDLSVTEGVNYAVNHGCKVINLSLVVPDASNLLKGAMRFAADNGVVSVGAAGNEVDVWYQDPQLANRILVAGACSSLDVLMPWSVTGASVDVYAPGELVIGAYGGSAHPNSYARWSGTSFSAPMTAGGAALLRSAHPTWTVTQIVSRIKSTTDVCIGALPLLSAGGRIDLEAALDD